MLKATFDKVPKFSTPNFIPEKKRKRNVHEQVIYDVQNVKCTIIVRIFYV